MLKKVLITLALLTSAILPGATAFAQGTANSISTYPQTPYTVGPNGGQWVVGFAQAHPTVTQACFTFTFSGNLLDPGEQFRAFLAGGSQVQLITNTGSTSLSSATTCFNNPTDLNLYRNQTSWVVRLFPVVGSVTVSSVTGTLVYSTPS